MFKVEMRRNSTVGLSTLFMLFKEESKYILRLKIREKEKQIFYEEINAKW